MKNDRALLARRMRGGPTFEKEGTQRIIMVFASLGFIALLVVPALDHRFGWSAVPIWAVVLGDILVVVGFYFMALPAFVWVRDRDQLCSDWPEGGSERCATSSSTGRYWG